MSIEGEGIAFKDENLKNDLNGQYLDEDGE